MEEGKVGFVHHFDISSTTRVVEADDRSNDAVIYTCTQ